MMSILKKTSEEFQVLDASHPVELAPASKTFDEAIASLDRYQKALEQRGHTSIRIMKVTKLKTSKWSDGSKTRYEVVNSEPVAVCRVENKRFVCNRWKEI
jgi:hypothetical protein